MLDSLVGISWRETLAIIVALLVLYVAFVFFRLRRLKQRQGDSAQEKLIPNSALDAVGAYLTVGAQGDGSSTESAVPAGTSSRATEAQAYGYSAYAGDTAAGDQYGLLINDLEREVAQLRKEVGSLRAEVLVLREEIYQSPPETVAPPVADEVSPYYSDAMQLALQGLDPDSISRHCAISRAEAELVLALVRNRDPQ